jgi:hypothetical protein
MKDLERIRNILSSEKIPRKTASKKYDYYSYGKFAARTTINQVNPLNQLSRIEQ